MRLSYGLSFCFFIHEAGVKKAQTDYNEGKEGHPIKRTHKKGEFFRKAEQPRRGTVVKKKIRVGHAPPEIGVQNA